MHQTDAQVTRGYNVRRARALLQPILYACFGYPNNRTFARPESTLPQISLTIRANPYFGASRFPEEQPRPCLSSGPSFSEQGLRTEETCCRSTKTVNCRVLANERERDSPSPSPGLTLVRCPFVPDITRRLLANKALCPRCQSERDDLIANIAVLHA